MIYLTVTRPDISHAVGMVSKFMDALHSVHYVDVLRILRYVKDALYHGLHYFSRSSLELHQPASEFLDYCTFRDPKELASFFCLFLSRRFLRSRVSPLSSSSKTDAIGVLGVGYSSFGANSS